jgi:hydroxypyruvate reductase 1
MRAGKYAGWLPTLFVGKLLQGATVGIVGAGRIGAAYARMMLEGHKCNLLYFDPYPNKALEAYVAAYSALLTSRGEPGVSIRRVETLSELLRLSDVVSLHTALDESTRHLMNASRLREMKPDGVLVTCARGPVVDEVALVAHLRAHPDFRCGLDVFEHEPAMAPGLAECPNAVIVPHIASASLFTRGGMATLAAANVAGRLSGFPVWTAPNDVAVFLEAPVGSLPRASPSIVNAQQLGLPTMKA